LGHAAKMALQVDSSKFFHSKSIEIDQKYYNDPIQTTPPHLGRILVSKYLPNEVRIFFLYLLPGVSFFFA